MKWFFYYLFFLSSTSGLAQVTVSVQWQRDIMPGMGDTIYYSVNRKLEWKDFQGSPDRNSDASAITASGFGYLLAMRSVNRRTTISIKVYCFYDKQHSWVKPGVESDYALLHEQHHFDITYINTCEFVEKLRKARFSLANYKALIERIYTDSDRAMEDMQNDYDGQTKNGRVKKIQGLWNKKVEEKLIRVFKD